MGAGKTRMAKRLASKLQLKRVDLDQAIEDYTGFSIAELFEKQGEAHFRELEHELLLKVASQEGQVISCGGGTPIFYDNMEIIKQNGLCLYLQAQPEVLFRHLKASKTKRPLLENKTDEALLRFIKNKLDERSPIYDQAHLVIESHTELDETVTRIKSWMENKD